MGKVVNILKKIGAVVTNSHIVYTSGKHGSVYINPDVLLPRSREVSAVAELFAQKYKDRDIDVVIAPAIGGIVLSTWVAYYLTNLKNKEILALFTEKTADNNQVLERGFDKLIKGKKTLIIEDITTTGGSVKKVVDRVTEAGGIVVEVCVMVNRDTKNVNEASVGAKFDSLDVLEAQAFDEKDCPLCKKGIPINTEVGHGKEYLNKRKFLR